MKLAVLGAGAWGTAISVSLAARHEVCLWLRDAALGDAISSQRRNQRYLPDIEIPAAVRVMCDFQHAIEARDLILVASSSAGLRPILRALADARDATPVVWLCKGFEAESGRLPHEIAGEELPAATRRGVLSGPSFAIEVARGLPAALTLAANEPTFSATMARKLNSETLRLYSSDDVVGVETAGAVKNVLAIAAGISDGLGLGLNARAALITRGLAEMTRLGIKLGGRAETFMGLAGAGDLILTCTGDLSRNRQVGLGLARGEALESIVRGLGHVAEGVSTALAVDAIAGRHQVELPITRAVCRIIRGVVPARDAVRELLSRDPKSEY